MHSIVALSSTCTPDKNIQVNLAMTEKTALLISYSSPLDAIDTGINILLCSLTPLHKIFLSCPLCQIPLSQELHCHTSFDPITVTGTFTFNMSVILILNLFLDHQTKRPIPPKKLHYKVGSCCPLLGGDCSRCWYESRWFWGFCNLMVNSGMCIGPVRGLRARR